MPEATPRKPKTIIQRQEHSLELRAADHHMEAPRKSVELASHAGLQQPLAVRLHVLVAVGGRDREIRAAGNQLRLLEGAVVLVLDLTGKK